MTDMAEINELRAHIQQLLIRVRNSENQINQLHPIRTTTQYEDVQTEITSGDQIQLESYRAIPEFSGDKRKYRSWRNQVTRRMDMIRNFTRHPKPLLALFAQKLRDLLLTS